jgi:hypothetical protein
MTRAVYRASVAGTVLAMAVLVAGCGQGSAPNATPPSGNGGSSGGSANPNAPETVPPGDIPDNQAYVPVNLPGQSFTVSVPEGWGRTTDAGATVFTSKFNSVRIESSARPAEPTIDSAKTDELPALRNSTPGYSSESVSSVQRKAGAAILVTYRANSAVDPVTGKSVAQAVERYEFWHNGTEVVLTLSCPQGADNVDPWRTITDSLRWQ